VIERAICEAALRDEDIELASCQAVFREECRP
jgi:hypothetical protein